MLSFDVVVVGFEVVVIGFDVVVVVGLEDAGTKTLINKKISKKKDLTVVLIHSQNRFL